MEDVRCPYLVVTSMCFIHKLWLDLHRSPQEIHRLVHKFPDQPTGGSPGRSTQFDPHSSIHTVRSTQFDPHSSIHTVRSTQRGVGNALPVLSQHRLEGAG